MSKSSLFGSCFATYEGDTVAVLQCVAETIDSHTTNQEASIRSWLLTFAGTIIFLMQLGFAMLCAGCVRRKNISNTLLKNVLDACCAGVAFFAVGYAFAFGSNNIENGVTFLGSENFFLIGLDDFAFWFFQYCFAAATGTIIAGTLAERCRMSAYLCYSFFMIGFIYPVVAHSLWSANGFLSPFSKNPYNGVGCIDFAGSGVVHLTGGMTSLIAAIIMGPRKGRFTNSRGVRLDTPRDIPGHSVALQVLGVLILWCGCKYCLILLLCKIRAPYLWVQISFFCCTFFSHQQGMASMPDLLCYCHMRPIRDSWQDEPLSI
jgi:Ammonium Transporter Family